MLTTYSSPSPCGGRSETGFPRISMASIACRSEFLFSTLAALERRPRCVAMGATGRRCGPSEKELGRSVSINVASSGVR